MDCERTRDLLDSFHDGELPNDTGDQVEAHLADCRGCTTARDELEAVDAALGQVPVPPMPPARVREIPALVAAELASPPAAAGPGPGQGQGLGLGLGLGRILRVGVLGLALGGTFLIGLEHWMELQDPVPTPPPPSEMLARVKDLRILVARTERELKAGRVSKARESQARAEALRDDLEKRYPGEGQPWNNGMNLDFRLEWNADRIADTPALDTESARKVHAGLFGNTLEQIRADPDALVVPAFLEGLVEQAVAWAQTLENLGRSAEVEPVLREALAHLETYVSHASSRRPGEASGMHPLPEIVETPLEPYWDLAEAAGELGRGDLRREILQRVLEHAEATEDALAACDVAHAHHLYRELAEKERRFDAARVHARKALAASLETLAAGRRSFPDSERWVGALRHHVNYKFHWYIERMLPDDERGPVPATAPREVAEVLAQVVEAQRVAPYGKSAWIESPRDLAIDVLRSGGQTLAARLEPLERLGAPTLALIEDLRGFVAADTASPLESDLEDAALRAVAVRFLCAGEDCAGVPAELRGAVRTQIRPGLEAASRAKAGLPARETSYEVGNWWNIHDDAVRVLEGAREAVEASR